MPLQKFAVGSAVEGTVTSLPKFGAFVQLSEGVEGMVHVSEISAEKRINHPQEVLKVGQTVKAQVIAVDTEKRLIRLSMKQLVPTGLDEYLAEHKAGDLVTGRLTEVTGGSRGWSWARACLPPARFRAQAQTAQDASSDSKADVSALGSMLMSRWKGGTAGTAAKPEPARAGQIRSFRITKLDPEGKKIELGTGVSDPSGRMAPTGDRPRFLALLPVCNFLGEFWRVCE